MISSIKNDLRDLFNKIKELDRKVVIVFLSVAVLQTVSWYYTSRSFFRGNIKELLTGYDNLHLIEYLFWFIGDFVSLFLLPVLIIKFLLKEKVIDYGLTFGDYRSGFKYTIIFLAVMIPLVWFASSQQQFSETYPHISQAKTNWNVFLIYEAGMLIYMFAWEFIWRGFMLFGLEKKFGYYTILIQTIPFVILHNGKPELETFGSIIAAIALGILALRTRSFLYGVFAHFGVMLSIDFISSLRFRTVDYGIGVNSLLNIIKEIF